MNVTCGIIDGPPIKYRGKTCNYFGMQHADKSAMLNLNTDRNTSITLNGSLLPLTSFQIRIDVSINKITENNNGAC